MQGMEILNQTVMPITTPNLLFILFVVVVWVALLVLTFIKIDEVFACVFCIMSGIFVVIPLTIMSPWCETKIGEYTKYKVTISDEVNFNEFTEKYEIISQEGKIYTIKERDDTQ